MFCVKLHNFFSWVSIVDFTIVLTFFLINLEMIYGSITFNMEHTSDWIFLNSFPSLERLSFLFFAHRTLTQDLKDQKDTGELEAKISYFPNNCVNLYKPTKKRKILKKLRNNKNVLITKLDRGNGAVIVDRIIICLVCTRLWMISQIFEVTIWSYYM